MAVAIRLPTPSCSNTHPRFKLHSLSRGRQTFEAGGASKPREIFSTQGEHFRLQASTDLEETPEIRRSAGTRKRLRTA